MAANPTEETWVLRISTDGVQWTTAGEVLPVGLNTPIFAVYGSRLVIVDATDGVPWGIRVWVHEGLPGS